MRRDLTYWVANGKPDPVVVDEHRHVGGVAPYKAAAQLWRPSRGVGLLSTYFIILHKTFYLDLFISSALGKTTAIIFRCSDALLNYLLQF